MEDFWSWLGLLAKVSCNDVASVVIDGSPLQLDRLDAAPSPVNAPCSRDCLASNCAGFSPADLTAGSLALRTMFPTCRVDPHSVCPEHFTMQDCRQYLAEGVGEPRLWSL